MSENDGSVWDEDRLRRVRLLEAIGLAQAAQTPLNVEELSRELDVSDATVRIELADLSALGLILDGLRRDFHPFY